MQYYSNNKYDWTYTEFVKKLLDNEIVGFTQLTDYHKVKRTGRVVLVKSNLFTMASNAFFERVSRHFNKSDRKLYSLTKEHLVKQLGENYLQIVRVMFDVSDDYVYRRRTKAYVLRKDVQKVFERAFIENIKRHQLLDGFGVKVSKSILDGNAVNKEIINQDGLRSKTKKSQIVMQNLYIPNQVKININRLTDAWKMYGELKYSTLGRKKLSIRTKRILTSAGVNFTRLTSYKVEKWEKTINELIVRSNTAPFEYGHIFQLYDERERGGRLYSQGAYGLQNLPKHIRHIIFSNLNYYDYDIVNCHYTILEQVNRMYGGSELSNVKQYGLAVSKTRNEIAKETGIHKDIIKTLMIGLVYGMGIDYNYRPWDVKLKKRKMGDLLRTLTATYGDENTAKIYAEKFVNVPIVKGLWADVKMAKDVILTKVKKTGSGDRQFLENHYGKKIKLSVEGEGKKLIKLSGGRQLSHILQGLEAYMMSEIISESNKDADTDYLVPYHDGWVCKGAINKKYYEQHLSNATMKRMSEYDGVDYKVGLDVKISGGKMADPYKKV